MADLVGFVPSMLLLREVAVEQDTITIREEE